jgi:hypothetical protein
MKPMARLALVVISLLFVGGTVCLAQEGDGMGQAFGRGNGVRGTVTAAGASSFTIRTDEGDTYQVLYSPNSRLMKDRQPIKTVGAVFLVDIDANEVRKARDAFGKTWVMGKVTAIHELRITIERAGDKQSQVVVVDENTSFRKRREDVTLADVKVGDMISAQGALHADTFLATTLRIMPPGSGPGRPAEPVPGP